MFPSSAEEKSLFWKYTTYVLYGCVAIFPFTYYNSFLYWGTSVRSVLLILVAALMGIAYAIGLFKKGTHINIIKSPILVAIGIYFVSIVVSGLLGLSFENTFWSVATRTTGVWYLFHLGLFILFLSGVLSDHTRQEKIISIVVISTAVYSFLSFVGPEGLNMLFVGFRSDGFTFGNSTFAAMYVFGAFLLSLYQVIHTKIKKWWMYVLPVVILLSPEIINPVLWSGDFSRGIVGDAKASAYVIAISVLCLALMWCISKIKDIRKRSITVYSIFGVVLFGIGIFALSLFSSQGYVRQLYLSQSTAARPLVWEMVTSAIQERPFFGWGSDNFERVFEVKYDNRLLQNEYGNEAWFDRAHNVFIDQMVDNGIIGLLSYLAVYVVIILCLIYVSLRSVEKKDRILASVLITYFALHLLELQTAFDTSISYFMLAIMVSLAVVIFHRTYAHVKANNSIWVAPSYLKYVLAGGTLLFLGWSLIWGWLPFVRAQLANGTIRTVGSSEKRMPYYGTLFGSPVDKHAFLWRTVTDFQRGIAQGPSVLEKPAKIEGLKKEAAIFEDEYDDYVDTHPIHFRAYLNLADILIYERLLGVDRLAKAQDVLDEAIELVPQSPQPYWMKAVAYVYMNKFSLAREYAKMGLELNPKIKQSQNVVDYVEKSIKTFPEIDLYYFQQI